MRAGSVAVGFIHPGEVSGSFASSLATTILNDREKGFINHVIDVQSSPRIAEGRSAIVDSFLEHTDSEWLLMIDSDMAWKPEAVHILLEHADVDECPIIGGLCFGGGRSIDEYGKPRIFPTIYQLIPEQNWYSTKIVYDYPRNQLLKVGATGAAFLMVNRKVFIRMANHLNKMPDGSHNPYPWFAEIVAQGRAVGEDITFCMRAQSLGFPVHVHTGAKVRHRKSTCLDEDLYDQMVIAALQESKSNE